MKSSPGYYESKAKSEAEAEEYGYFAGAEHYENNITLSGGVGVGITTRDPSSEGAKASTGSVLIQVKSISDVDMWVKSGPEDTDWNPFGISNIDADLLFLSGEIDSNLETLSGQIADVASDVADLTIRVSTAETNIETLSGELKTNIENLSGELDDLEESVVLLTGDQTIDGVKTFEHPPMVFPQIGDIGQAGGWVFYVDEVNNLVYECAPSDQSTGIAWITGGDTQTEAIGTTGTAIGTGKDNTDEMEADDGYTGGAAKVCLDLVVGGYSDWFLPSKDELDAMYDNLKAASIGGFGTGYYWSSSEASATTASIQYFSTGAPGTTTKNSSSLSVRAARSYSLSSYPSEVATLPTQIVEAGDANYTISDGNTPLTVIFRDITSDRSCYMPTLSANQNREITVILASITTAGKKVTCVHEGTDKMNGYAADIDINQAGGWWKHIGTSVEWRSTTNGESTVYEVKATVDKTPSGSDSGVWYDVTDMVLSNLPIGIYNLEAYGEIYFRNTGLSMYADLRLGIGTATGGTAPSIVVARQYLYLVANHFERNIITLRSEYHGYSNTDATTDIYMKMYYNSDEPSTTFAVNAGATEPIVLRAKRIA